MKEMLLLCTKDVDFLFKDENYQQTDSAAMGSPLNLIFAGIFMVELETKVVWNGAIWHSLKQNIF